MIELVAFVLVRGVDLGRIHGQRILCADPDGLRHSLGISQFAVLVVLNGVAESLGLTLALLPHGIEDGVGHDGIYCFTGSIYYIAIFRRAPSLKSVAFAGESNFSIAENGVAVTSANFNIIDFVVLVNLTSVIIRVIRHGYSNAPDIAVDMEGLAFMRLVPCAIFLGYTRPFRAQR